MLLDFTVILVVLRETATFEGTTKYFLGLENHMVWSRH